MPNDGDREFVNGEETGLIWSSKHEDWIHPDLDECPEKYHSPLYYHPNRTPESPEPVDGEKEYHEGLETGLVWSDNHKDWVHPDLDKCPEKYHNEEDLERILNA